MLCGLNLPANAVPYSFCHVLVFKETAICLSIFLGLGDFFFLSFFPHTHSWHLVFCVCGKLPTPWEKHLCTDHCQTEVHKSGHLWAILLSQEEQMLFFSTTEGWLQNAWEGPQATACTNKILSCEVIVIIKLNCKVSMGNKVSWGNVALHVCRAYFASLRIKVH